MPFCSYKLCTHFQKLTQEKKCAKIAEPSLTVWSIISNFSTQKEIQVHFNHKPTNVYNYAYILHVQYTAHVCVSVWRRALLYTADLLVCTSKRASIYHCLCLTFYIRFRLTTFYQRVCGIDVYVYVYVFVYVHWNVCVVCL